MSAGSPSSVGEPVCDNRFIVLYRIRGTFRQVPTRRIRLSFVKCAYSDLRDIFFFIILEV